ncbi:cytoplasmic protein, partial [Bacillus cereus]
FIFIDFDDLSYFQNYDLVVSYRKKTEEIQFNYVK